ncbi:MAG: protein kinase [Myxococcota bacterium]
MSGTLPRAFGSYLLLARLGKGGAGSAYLSRHREDIYTQADQRTPIVVKCLHKQLRSHGEFIKRFRHEAEVAVRVKSPHVVRVLDAGEVGSLPYIAMDYIRGWTVSRVHASVIDGQSRLSIALAIELTLQILQGLVALHEATDAEGQPLDTVHRDLAPKNIMVGDDGRVRLIDLGLGKSRVQDWKTSTGAVMGSPGYMAPEQLKGQPVDQRTDLYAIGIVLHEMLVGRRYIEPGPPLDMLRQAMEHRYEAPSRLREEVSPALDEVVAQAMAPRLDDRFPDARAFLAALNHVLPRRPGAASIRQLIEKYLGQARRTRDVEVLRLLGMPEPNAPAEEAVTRVFVRHPEAPEVTRAVDIEDAAQPTQNWAPLQTLATPSTSSPSSSSFSSFAMIQQQPGYGFLVAIALVMAFGTGLGLMLASSSVQLSSTPAPIVPPADMTRPSVQRAPDVTVRAPIGDGTSRADQAATPEAPTVSEPVAGPRVSESHSSGPRAVQMATEQGPTAQPTDADRSAKYPEINRSAEMHRTTDASSDSRRATKASARDSSTPSAQGRRSAKRVRRTPRTTKPVQTVETRSTQLQNRIAGALKETTDASRRALLARLLGRLSMIQAGRDAAQQRQQLSALEKELNDVLKGKAGTSADPQ